MLRDKEKNEIKNDKDISLRETLNEYKLVTCKNEKYQRLVLYICIYIYIYIYNNTTSHTGRTKAGTGTTNSTTVRLIT